MRDPIYAAVYLVASQLVANANNIRNQKPNLNISQFVNDQMNYSKWFNKGGLIHFQGFAGCSIADIDTATVNAINYLNNILRKHNDEEELHPTFYEIFNCLNKTLADDFGLDADILSFHPDY
jgi:hypothetical protein